MWFSQAMITPSSSATGVSVGRCLAARAICSSIGGSVEKWLCTLGSRCVMVAMVEAGPVVELELTHGVVVLEALPLLVGGGHVDGEAAVPDQSAVIDLAAHGFRPGPVVDVLAGVRVEPLKPQLGRLVDHPEEAIVFGRRGFERLQVGQRPAARAVVRAVAPNRGLEGPPIARDGNAELHDGFGCLWVAITAPPAAGPRFAASQQVTASTLCRTAARIAETPPAAVTPRD